MKVTIIGPAYPLRGGIAHHVYYLKRELIGRGHSVQVISFRKLYPRLLFPGSTQLDTSASVLDAGAAAILTPLNPISWYKAARAVKSFAPQVAIFQWWNPFFAPVVGMLARSFRRMGIRCVIECHNVFPHERSWVDRMLLGFAVGPADAFITHSIQDKNDLTPFVSGKSVGVSALPSPNEFKSGLRNDRSGRTILFFGVVRKYKGLDVLLAAMPKVLARMECRLEIAGEFYESLDKYQKLVEEYGLANHVRIFNRYIPNEEISEIFAGADVMVLPYLSATQSAVAHMALANGLPVIASRTGGLPEVVIENLNGLLFPPGDSHALADQITHYFANALGPVFARNLMNETTAKTTCIIGELVERAVEEPVS